MLCRHFNIFTLLVAALTGLSTGEPYLVGLAQGFTERDEIVQGWALVENLCPDGTGTCGRRSCCPIGSYCDDNEGTNSNICCPTRTGCAYDVSKASRCAVSSWVEWFTSKDPICCLPGEIGVQPGPSDYYGYCSSAGSDIASSLRASTILSPSTAAATSKPVYFSSPTPTASAGSSALAAGTSTPSTASSTSATASFTKTATPSAQASTAAANFNTEVNQWLSIFLGIIAGITAL